MYVPLLRVKLGAYFPSHCVFQGSESRGSPGPCSDPTTKAIAQAVARRMEQMRPRSATRAVRIDSDSSVGLSDATMLSGSEFKLAERRGRVKVCPGGRGVGDCRRRYH